MTRETMCIVVSGLPASGKSTVGQAVARRLGLPFLDKDAFLERLFASSDAPGGDAWRRRLSSESNVLFEQAAVGCERAVLVSHWRPGGLPGPSGTPTEWIHAHFDKVVELYCVCPAMTAVERFKRRERHIGHNDSNRTHEELIDWFSEYAGHLPMGLGALVEVRSNQAVDPDTVARRVHNALVSPSP